MEILNSSASMNWRFKHGYVQQFAFNFPLFNENDSPENGEHSKHNQKEVNSKALFFIILAVKQGN